MANVRTFLRSFAGGEVTPEFYGRIDDAKFQTGLAKCLNFICLPHGPVANRPGFSFVREVKTSSRKTRLIPFSYSITQTMVLEFGHEYVRFHTQGGTLMNGAVPYEVATPYVEADLFDLHFVQSADVLTLTHPNYQVRELRRLGALNWTLDTVTFGSKLSPPTGVSASATPGTTPGTPTTQTYVVSSVGPNGLDESTYSAVATCSNNLFDDGAFNTITWSAATGATRYYVYKLTNGLYGYIGQTQATTFKDENIGADMSVTPPEINNPFLGAGNYPAAVSYFEQRRCFGGTINAQQTLWMTKSGTESNLNYSIPTRDDDSITFRVAAREANTIRHIVPLQTLILLTSSAEWRVTSINTDAITPNSLSVKPQSYVGANNVQPVIVNNNMIFAAARGGHVRELAYSMQVGGYLTGDLSLRAPHLFDNLEIKDMAFAKAPQQIIWFVSSSGKLLGLTYVPEHMIGSWHQHDTDGLFESCAVVAEGNEDVLYVVVKRTIGGQVKRYVERMASRQFANQADAFFVDSGLSYSGTPVTTVSGLGHLEGKTVNILADGAVHPQRVVTGGSITLDNAASTIHVGLPITADVQTLPMSFDGEAYGQGRVKNVNKVWLRVFRSSGIFVGPSPSELVEAKQRTIEPYGAPPELKSEEIEVVVTPTWSDGGQVYVRQSDPIPLTLVSMTVQATIGA